MDLNGIGREVISILAVYYATTSDADTHHNNYVLDITSQWSASWSNSVTMLHCLHCDSPTLEKISKG